MASIRWLLAWVKSASVTTKANASDITYTINYIDDSGGVVEATNQRPSGPVYPDYVEGQDDGCMYYPFPVGIPFQAVRVDGRIYWLFKELPAIAGCPTTSGGMLMMRDPRTGELVPVIPTVDGIPTLNTGGTPGGSIPGGGADGAPAGGGGEM